MTLRFIHNVLNAFNARSPKRRGDIEAGGSEWYLPELLPYPLLTEAFRNTGCCEVLMILWISSLSLGSIGYQELPRRTSTSSPFIVVMNSSNSLSCSVIQICRAPWSDPWLALHTCYMWRKCTTVRTYIVMRSVFCACCYWDTFVEQSIRFICKCDQRAPAKVQVRYVKASRERQKLMDRFAFFLLALNIFWQ